MTGTVRAVGPTDGAVKVGSERKRAGGGMRSESGPELMGVLWARDGRREARVGAADGAFVGLRRSERG